MKAPFTQAQTLCGLSLLALIAVLARSADSPLKHEPSIHKFTKDLDPASEDIIRERGLLALAAQKVAASYDQAPALHLRVQVLSAFRPLSPDERPEKGGLSQTQLEAFAPEPNQDALVDWRMTNRNEFSAFAYFGSDREIPRSRIPDWGIVSAWTSGQRAHEFTPEQTSEEYELTSYAEGRQPRLFPAADFDCGEFSMFPFTLCGEWAREQSPRAGWKKVFAEGRYEGLCRGANGTSYHRVAWFKADRDGSIDRIFRLYLNPTTWRIDQIDEIGAAHGPKRAVVMVVKLSWRIEEVSQQIEPGAFDFSVVQKSFALKTAASTSQPVTVQ